VDNEATKRLKEQERERLTHNLPITHIHPSNQPIQPNDLFVECVFVCLCGLFSCLQCISISVSMDEEQRWLDRYGRYIQPHLQSRASDLSRRPYAQEHDELLSGTTTSTTTTAIHELMTHTLIYSLILRLIPRIEPTTHQGRQYQACQSLPHLECCVVVER